MDKKQSIPLPPSPPATTTNMNDKVDVKVITIIGDIQIPWSLQDASKPEKMSYALVAQKAKGKPGEMPSSQPGSPPAEVSNEPTNNQPCSPDKAKDTVPL